MSLAFSSKWVFSSYLWHFKSCNFPALSNKCSKFSFILSCHATQPAGSSYFITFVWFDAITAILFSRFPFILFIPIFHPLSINFVDLSLGNCLEEVKSLFTSPSHISHQVQSTLIVHFKCFPNVLYLISKQNHQNTSRYQSFLI